MDLLRKGNSKLGRELFTFSIPAGDTCPGKSAACSACYALSGHFTRPSVRKFLLRNHAASLRADFSERMIEEILTKNCKVVRIHVAGDFYSKEYTLKWLQVVRACPSVKFYAYTRSWRVKEILPALRRLARLSNFRLWLSADSDTGQPVEMKGARVAWLISKEGEQVGKTEFPLRHRFRWMAHRTGVGLPRRERRGVGSWLHHVQGVLEVIHALAHPVDLPEMRVGRVVVPRSKGRQ